MILQNLNIFLKLSEKKQIYILSNTTIQQPKALKQRCVVLTNLHLDQATKHSSQVQFLRFHRKQRPESLHLVSFQVIIELPYFIFFNIPTWGHSNMAKL